MRRALILLMLISNLYTIDSGLIVKAKEVISDEYVSRYETWDSELSGEELIYEV